MSAALLAPSRHPALAVARRVLRALLLLVLLGGALWSAGFAWFLHVATRPVPPPPHADGIVVLTGGAERVETALRLLAEGRAERLLVSGVGAGTELREIVRRAGGDASGGLAARVALGHAAHSTVGNAAETAAWAAANGVRSLIVVTSGYHMPRALHELAHDLPGVALYAVPVVPPALRGGVPAGGVLRLLAGEYTKWLAAGLGLSRLREAA